MFRIIFQLLPPMKSVRKVHSINTIASFSTTTVDYADLPIIDLSQAHDADGRRKLASQVTAAMSTLGFFYIINHGYSAAEVRDGVVSTRKAELKMHDIETTRIFDIADIPFSGVAHEEKIQYEGKMKQTGSYQGYKLRQYWVISFQVCPKGTLIIASTLTMVSTTKSKTTTVRHPAQLSRVILN